MVLIGAFVNDKIVFSEAKEENIDLILGCIFNKYIQGEDFDTEFFNSKLLVIEDNELKSKVNKKINSIIQTEEVDGLALFEEMKGYSRMILFDKYEMFEYSNCSYKELCPNNYKINICSHCGKPTVELLMDHYCPECFVSYGIQEIFNDILEKDNELYTEYEQVSKIMNAVDRLSERIRNKGEAARAKGREVAENFLKKENVQEDLCEAILGGFLK